MGEYGEGRREIVERDVDAIRGWSERDFGFVS
jgi:hypothetical protein